MVIANVVQQIYSGGGDGGERAKSQHLLSHCLQ